MNELGDIDFGQIDGLDFSLDESENSNNQNAFEIRENFIKRNIAKKKLRGGLRKLIKPENAKPVFDALPWHDGDSMHAVIKGDFVLCDLIPFVFSKKKIKHLTITSLGMSESNSRDLESWIVKGHILSMSVLLSHFFASVDRSDKWLTCKGCLLPHGVNIGMARIHTKIILFDFFDDSCPLVIEGSANLRSSANVEQIACFADRELYEFHKAWIDEVIEKNKVND
jgi:hypothetical protein